ncbi:MAG TPA: sugar ABC transporter permease [Anaerolineales bacterium]|nr:sugar ABC transporter permease [Anaerolineales bacterium]
MAQVRGWRKVLTVLAFISPTLIGILIFSIYPILFNTYISFTNRNQFHPNPDCAVGLTGLLEPTCWAVFKKHAVTGLGTPFRLQTPLFGNYASLMGTFFTAPALLSVLKVAVCFIPLIVAGFINRRYSRELERPISAGTVNLIAVILGAIIFFGLSGLSAFNSILASSDFFTVFLRTILFVVVCIPLFFIFGMGLALLLNVKDLPGKTFFRVVLIVPWAASNVSIMMSLVFRFFFSETGTLNQLLHILNVQPVIFLNSSLWTFFIIVLANVWYSYPFFMVTILGALQSIPAELYEAAEVDGANWGQKLTRITMPLLRPAVVPLIVLSAIGAGGFQMFGTAWAINQGGPSQGAGVPGGTDLVMTYAYKQVFQTNAYGRMGAFAVIIFIMLFIATIASLRVSRVTKGAYE